MKITTKFLGLATLCATLATGAAQATETLTVGAVGCINLKSAQQYASYMTSAPDFAEDLLDRATCYVNKDAAEAVKLSTVNGYTQYKLITGHKVWMVPGTPATVAQPAKAPASK